MGWYREPSATPITWQRRMAITVYNNAGAASYDVDAALPTTWSAFWSVIDAAGDAIRVTRADGVTLLNYMIDDGAGGAFDGTATSRAGRIRIGGAPLGSPVITLLWVYYDPTATATDASTVFVPASPLTGYIDLGRPGTHRFPLQPEPPNAATPRSVVAKPSSARVDLWFRVDPALNKLARAEEGSRSYEEPAFYTTSVVDSADVAQAAMVDNDADRFVWIQELEQLWIRTPVLGGTDGNPYTVIVEVETVFPLDSTRFQHIETRVGLEVDDVLLT